MHLLGQDLFVSPRAEMGALLEEERAQPMEAAKNIQTAMFTDYPKGKQITTIIPISAKPPFHLDGTFTRLEHTSASVGGGGGGTRPHTPHTSPFPFLHGQTSRQPRQLLLGARWGAYLAPADEHAVPSPPRHYFPKQCQLINLCKHGKSLHRKTR